MDLGSIESESHTKLFIEWVMPYPDFLPNFESTSMTDLGMFLPIILLEEKMSHCNIQGIFM
jgi:hypothetical protein